MLAYTGLRMGELLGLCWADVDFDAGLLRIHHRQLSRDRVHAQIKTAGAEPEVILAPGCGAPPARALAGDAVQDRRGLRRPGRLSLHSLRHGYASLLTGKGLKVVFVSRQLGHANPT